MNKMTISSVIVLLAITSMAVTAPSAFADHAKVTIVALEGSGSPSAEEFYSPAIAIVDEGGEIVFSNPDNVPHSFTSGTPNDDVTGTYFMSGPSEAEQLLMAGQSYSITADFGIGDFNYYCMVHPWMVGIITVQAAASEESHDGHDGHDEKSEMEMQTLMADGIHIDVPEAASVGERVPIDVSFDAEHVNYDIVATHNGETILDEKANHLMENGEVRQHFTSALSADASSENPIDVIVTFQGFGMGADIDDSLAGLTNTAQVVPEFGTIAALILVVAITSIIAVSAKSRLSFMPRI